jgi:glyoxylate reductase
MPASRLTVVVTRRLPEAVETRMKELFDVELRDPDVADDARGAGRGDAAGRCAGADDHRHDRRGASGAGGREAEADRQLWRGVDHIDVATARQRGILVSNTPGVVTEDTADMVMALILAVTRRIPQGLQVMQAGGWTGWSPMANLGGRLGGRRLGILGMGRIGQAVARRARAFGLQVHYHNRKRVRPEIEAELEATYWESLDQMLARMDIVSVNCPHTPSTFHLLNARRLKLMKPSAVVVNTSRGEVIDENALTRGAAGGRAGGGRA